MELLIVYYSYSGITRRLAEDIALITDGELRELKPQKPYSFSHNTAVKEARYESSKYKHLLKYLEEKYGFESEYEQQLLNETSY